jgi:hypothetical protein
MGLPIALVGLVVVTERRRETRQLMLRQRRWEWEQFVEATFQQLPHRLTKETHATDIETVRSSNSFQSRSGDCCNSYERIKRMRY